MPSRALPDREVELILGHSDKLGCIVHSDPSQIERMFTNDNDGNPDYPYNRPTYGVEIYIRQGYQLANGRWAYALKGSIADLSARRLERLTNAIETISAAMEDVGRSARASGGFFSGTPTGGNNIVIDASPWGSPAYRFNYDGYLLRNSRVAPITVEGLRRIQMDTWTA